MFKSIIPLGLLLIFGGSVFSQDLVTGTVFEDKNGDGIQNTGEPGIPKVSVSNGETVVITGKNGKYNIPLGEEGNIFVIKPSDYQYPVNEDQLVSFYYLHRPLGSPDLEFSGLTPTGSLPEAVNFPLIKKESQEDFSILVFSDPQPYSIREVGYYEDDIVEDVKRTEQYSFGITLGDNVGDNLDLFYPLVNATKSLSLPWYYVLGNHDMNFDAKVREHSDETYESRFGPSTYAFNEGKVHFIILNDVIFPNTYNDRFYVGGLSERQFTFIENDLKNVPEDFLVVLCMHIPLFNEEGWGETFRNADRERLFKILSPFRYTLSLSGHTHIQKHYFFTEKDGWLQDKPHHHYNVGTASGDWWSGRLDVNGIPYSTMRDGTPNGYNVLKFEGNSYAYEYFVAGNPTEKMRIYGPKTLPEGKYSRASFYVNFYQGSDNDSVFYRINQGEWKKMSYVVEPDPYFSGIRYEWDSSEELLHGTRPSNPINSYHLWRARSPYGLQAGSHTMEIKVVDQFGREYRDQREFKVVKE